jgi:hypothetical protein
MINVNCENTGLHDNDACLLFGDVLVLLQIKVQIVSVAVLEHSAKGVVVNGNPRNRLDMYDAHLKLPKQF